MRHIIGISIGGTKTAICYAFLNDKNDILSIEKKVIKTDPNNPYKTMDLVYSAIDSFPQDFDFVSVIVGSPLDAEKGIIKAPSNLPGWIEFPVCKLLNERYNVKSALLNDADASALAEYYYGAGKNKGYKNFIYMIVGTGFGSGLIINGKLYPGSTYTAGEIGYIKSLPTGYMPRNKKPGTFEGFVSGGGIGDYANIFVKYSPESSLTKIKEGEITAKDVFVHARNGDEFALSVVKQCAIRLGEAVTIMINLLNPDAIAIGGIYPRGLDLLEKQVLETVKENALPINFGHVKIVPSELEEQIDDYSSLMAIINKAI